MDFLFPVEAGLVFCQNEFLTILLLKIQALWDVTLCCWVAGSQCVDMLCCFILKGNRPMMVILCGLITLEEESCVVSEWFPVSILNDCVCDFHLPDSKKSHLCGVITLEVARGTILWNVGSQWPKDTASFPRRHGSSALVFNLAYLKKCTEQQQLLLFFGRLLDFILSYYSSKWFWGKILSNSFRLFFYGVVLLVVIVVQQT